MFLTGVGLVAEPMPELQAEGEAEFTEPPVVLKTGAGPNCTRMLCIVNRQVTMVCGAGGRGGSGAERGGDARGLG